MSYGRGHRQKKQVNYNEDGLGSLSDSTSSHSSLRMLSPHDLSQKRVKTTRADFVSDDSHLA